MQNAETVLGVLRERGRRGLPLDKLYRQMFNPQLYLLAYGRIYANKGAMTPGVTQDTVDGMSVDKIDRIIDAMRHERYTFEPVRRVHIPKKSGKLRPLGLPTWSVRSCACCWRRTTSRPFPTDPTGSGPQRGCHSLSSFLCKSGAVCWWLAGCLEAAGEVDLECVECLFPAVGAGAGGAAAGGGEVSGDESEELEGGVVGGEVPAVPGDLAELVVDGLDQVGGVDDRADLGREREERGELLPGVAPEARGSGRPSRARRCPGRPLPPRR